MQGTKARIAPHPLERIFRLFGDYLEFALEHPRHFDFLFLDRRPNLRSIEELEAAGCLALWAQAHGMIALYRAGRFGDDAEALRGVYRRSFERLIGGLACA